MGFELSKVCENKVTTMIRVIHPLDHFGSTSWLWCTWVDFIAVPYYQAEERFEGNEELLKLVGSNETGWAELWEPIMKEIPQFSLRKIPGLLKPVDKIDFGRLKSELIGLNGQESDWEDKMVAVITWPTIVGIMLIVVMASLSWWWWRKRQMKDSEGSKETCCEDPAQL